MKTFLKYNTTPLLFRFLIFICLLPLSPQASVDNQSGPTVKRVLLYDHTVLNRYVGLRSHLRKVLTQMGGEHQFTLTITRNENSISYLNLKSYDLVIFAYSNGDVITSSKRQGDFERYVREGGGFMAINATAGSIRRFSFLEDAVGPLNSSWNYSLEKGYLYVDSQAVKKPELQPILKAIPREAVLKNRWINRNKNPEDNSAITVLFSVDESAFRHGSTNGDRPIVWTRSMGEGRVVSYALNHNNIYSKKNIFGTGLLWSLMEYAANKNTNTPRAKPSVIDATGDTNIHVALDGRRAILFLGEGDYSLRISDLRGRTVLSKTYSGPGQFYTDPISVNGLFTVALTGPATQYQTQVMLK